MAQQTAQAMGDKAEKLYDILQNDQHYKDVLPDKQTFVDKLQNEQFANSFHSILTNDDRYNTVVPDFNRFYKSIQVPISKMESKPITNMPSDVKKGIENLSTIDLTEARGQVPTTTKEPVETVATKTIETPNTTEVTNVTYTPRQPSAALPSAAELSLRKTPVKKMTPQTGSLLLKEPVRERLAREYAKEYYGLYPKKEEETKAVPKGSVTAAMFKTKYPKGYEPDLPKIDAFSLDNIMALTDKNQTHTLWDAQDKLSRSGYDASVTPWAENEKNKEMRGETKILKGLSDKDFLDMLKIYNDKPNAQKITDDHKAALIVDRRKRQAAGYFDFKNNLNSNLSKEDLEACTGDKVCRSSTSFPMLDQQSEFKDYHKQTIMNAYKDLNPGKEFTKEMEAEVDDFLKLREEEKEKEKQKNRNLQSK